MICQMESNVEHHEPVLREMATTFPLRVITTIKEIGSKKCNDSVMAVNDIDSINSDESDRWLIKVISFYV